MIEGLTIGPSIGLHTELSANGHLSSKTNDTYSDPIAHERINSLMDIARV
jgi:hypothetical protein